MQDLIKIVAMGKTFCRHKIEVRLCYNTNKFVTRPACQLASESGALQWRQNSYEGQDLGLNSSALSRFLNVKNVSAEQVWTPRELQTVEERLHKTLSLQMI